MALTLITHVLGTFRYVTMNVGDNGEGIRDLIFDVESDGVAFHDVIMNGRNCCICVHCKSLLKAER